MLPTNYREFIYKRTYSRWIESEGRREEWNETVDRFKKFFETRIPEGVESDFYEAIDGIRNFESMPSMRALWTAGDALEFDNICGYNCAYTILEETKDFAEILYILMNGTGVGFSTERQYVNNLPQVPEELEETAYTIEVKDSKQGWAEAFYSLLENLYFGKIVNVDYSQIRPKGARLKTFGGRASGPEPLIDLFEFTVNMFKKARGRKLNSLEVYDIVTKTAEIVIVGGVRRSATINLSNLSDERMAKAKQGEFWIHHPNRSLSNNSVAYTEKPEAYRFMEEWMNLATSGTGERGIINREGLKKHIEDLGLPRETEDIDFGTNPCGETILRPRGLCNLTEVVVRPKDTKEEILYKIKKAVFIGILQSTLTDFNFLKDDWKNNQEEERLLGVSFTGMKDHPVIGKNTDKTEAWLKEFRKFARKTAEHYAEKFDINVPAGITVVKPSGTVSQLVNSSSGIHPRHSEYYIRRVRVASGDPLCEFLRLTGVPNHPEVGQVEPTVNTYVFEFPMKAPETSIIRGQESALEQLEYWKTVKTNWTEHNPSQTVYVKDEEWLEVGAWVYKNWDLVTGISFLPYDGGVYKLAPYEDVDKATYEDLLNEMPEIDWSLLNEMENEDHTEGAREYACSGGGCDIV
jgi:ribonucleoside-diphosphate reductase alpha chain